MNDDATLSSPPSPESGTPLPASLDDLKKPRNYEVGDTHATGGMGAILCTKDLNISRTVAMKVMLGDRATHTDQLLRFVDEAKITGQLEHPNIVPVHELGIDEQGRPFYTMKFVMGVTLKQVLDEIKEGKPEALARYSLAHLLTIFQKTCDAVAFAHARGVVHRDLKPENIMLGEYGEVLVLDWGLAKLIGETKGDSTSSTHVPTRLSDSGVHLTMDGTIMGTPQFMAPEQAEGQIDRIDARTDIYALGGILYNLLTLQVPVTGNNVNEVLEKVRSGQITPPSAVAAVYDRRDAATPKDGGHRPPLQHLPDARLPDSLCAVAMKAMALAREDRYQSVKELQLDIEAYQNGFATLAENASAWKQFTLFIKRNQAVSIAVAASLLLLAGVSTAFTLRVIGERNRTAAERDRANVERDRANATLAQLRGTAPTFHEQAKALLDQGKLDDALVKIGYAIELVDQNADYRLFRANLLEATQRLADAATEYRRVLALRPVDTAAKQNLALCERLLAENGGAATLRREIQVQLVDALLAQKRKIEVAPLALLLGKDQDIARIAILARIKECSSQLGWSETRLKRLPNGTFLLSLGGLAALGDLGLLQGLPIAELDLHHTGVSDLSPLVGLPLTTLNIQGTSVSDLSPLRSMKLLRDLIVTGSRDICDLSPLKEIPLTTLFCGETGVTDLSPLKGMPLTELLCHNTQVSDLTPLRDMPLTRLKCFSTHISNLTPLRGMPLTVLWCHGTQTSDLAPLEGMQLEELAFTPKSITKGLEIVRRMKSLKRITDDPSGKGMMTPERFWKEYDTAKAKAGK